MIVVESSVVLLSKACFNMHCCVIFKQKISFISGILTIVEIAYIFNQQLYLSFTKKNTF